MNKRTIENAWFDYVKENAGQEVTVIFADEDDPRPAKPYVALKIISGPTGSGFDELRFVSAKPLAEDPQSKTVRFNVTGMRQYTMNIQAFASKLEPHISQDVIDRLHTLLDSPLTTEFFKKAADIAIAGRGTPTDITIPLETGFERRTSLDVLFNSSQAIAVNPSAIESVQVGGKLISIDGSEKTVGDIDVPTP